MFLGLVLLVAAVAKALEPGAFAEQIRLEQLDFLFSVRTVTLIALALEVGLGTVLILGIRRLWVLFPATLLASFFLFLTGRNYWLVLNGLRDEDAACGCFGSLIEGEHAIHDGRLNGVIDEVARFCRCVEAAGSTCGCWTTRLRRR